MPILNISNVLVDFPFEPYDCQKDYMETVMSALQNRRHALLESPTGTGKTICLLCASLAWQESYKGKIEFHRAEMRKNVAGQSLGDLEEQLVKAVGSGYADGQNPASSFSPTAPKIIYASRTHSQLSQAIEQLKRTSFRSARVAVVGSRDQLCLHEEVRALETNAAKVLHCRMRVKSRTCEYYRNFEGNKTSLTASLAPSSKGGNPSEARNTDPSASRGNDAVLDIEELVSIGKERRCCPYYLSRELKNCADIIFMPYNYLLDARIRRRHNIDLQNAVVIFDEAHNIEKVCEDSASVELSSTDLALAIEELRQLAEELHALIVEGADSFQDSPEQSASKDDVLHPETHLGPVLAVKGQLLELEKAIDALEVHRDDGLIRPGDFIFDLLQEAEITWFTYKSINSLIDKILKYVTSSSNHRLRKANGLTKVDAFLQAVFVGDTTAESLDTKKGGLAKSMVNRAATLALMRSQISTFYRVFIRDGDSKPRMRGTTISWDGNQAGGTRQRVVCYWCFSPGRAMTELLMHGIHSLILTSGTLYPLESFKTGLGVSFDLELRNGHVIDNDQMWIGALTRGPDGSRLNSSYETRGSAQYQSALGYTIANFARVVPQGLLVFFPSYSLMDQCLNFWKSSNADIYTRIAQHKPIIVEPKKKTEFQQAMDEYEKKIRDPAYSGAVIFGVARGKVSEGMDFSDNFGRAVIITGLPFAPCMDPRVKLKMSYLDEARIAKAEGQTGRAWYRQDAWRAINQAIGRVIRHRRDYGAVVLCDERFGSGDARAQLPDWMQGMIKVHNNFGSCVRDLTQFFKFAGEKYPFELAEGGRRPERQAHAVADRAKSSNPQKYWTSQGGVTRSCDNEQLGPSLRLTQPDAVETVKMSFDYASSGGSGGTGSSAGSSGSGLMNMLDKHEKAMSGQAASRTKRSLSCSSGSSVDPMERRLEKLQKRRKLVVKEAGSPVSADKSFMTRSYVERVKQTFASDPAVVQRFKAAVEMYKRKGDLGSLKNELIEMFVYSDAPDLARDFSVFVKPEQKEEFARFCEEQLGLGLDFQNENSGEVDATIKNQGKDLEFGESEKRSGKENASEAPAIKCAKCGCGREEGTGSKVFLAAACGHVCCFPCWRAIIESGSKRCPSCKSFVRRRNLSRIKF